jgi:excisionase family DNA binding protein
MNIKKFFVATALALLAAIIASSAAAELHQHHLAFLVTAEPMFLAAAAPMAAVVRPELYTRAEACRLLSISMSTLYVLIAKGELRAVKIVGATRITAESLNKLLVAAPKAEMSKYYLTPRSRRREQAVQRA